MRRTRIGLLLAGALALTACGGGPAATSSTPAVSGAVHIANIGKPVTIVAPPAAEVKEVSEDAYKLYGGS